MPRTNGNDQLGDVFNVFQGVSTAPETVEKATAVLKDWAQAGRLAPLYDWDGGLVEGYMDMLGLNGRRVKMNRASKGNAS